MASVLIEDIVQQLNDLHDGDLWLDENFEKKLSQVNDQNAFVRPVADMHSVAELISHIIVWRRVNVRRLDGESVTLEIDDPVNWKNNEELRTAGWENLKQEFYKSKQEVIALLNGKDDAYLDTVSTHYGKDFKYLLQGLVHHDLYHMGQLGITIKYLALNEQKH